MTDTPAQRNPHLRRGRLFLALAAWPLGIALLVTISLLLPAREVPCDSATETSTANTLAITCVWERPAPSAGRAALALLIAFGPGIAATTWWFRTRRGPS